jgi:hypothetical protein
MTDTSRIGTIGAGLISIILTIADIKTAQFPAPPNLDTASLPGAYILTGSNTYDLDAVEVTNMTRIFRVQVACLPTASGNPYERELIVPPLIEKTATAINAKRYNHGLAFVETIRVVTDSGIVILPEFGAKFIGFELQVEAKYFERRS